MALKDCIRKMKGLVSRADIKLLEQYIADGLNDEEAVRKLTLESDYNVVVITKRAVEQGAAVAERPGFLAEIRSIQEKRAEKIRAERIKLEEEQRRLNVEYGANNMAIDKVRAYHLVIAAEPLDIHDEQQLNTVLSAMLFDTTNREQLERGVLGLKGKTPLELVESFKVLRDGQREIRERMREILVLDNAAVAQLGEIGAREKDTLFQMDSRAQVDTKGKVTFEKVEDSHIDDREQRVFVDGVEAAVGAQISGNGANDVHLTFEGIVAVATPAPKDIEIRVRGDVSDDLTIETGMSFSVERIGG